MIQPTPTWYDRAVDAAIDMLCGSNASPANYCKDLDAIEEYLATMPNADQITPRQAALEAIAALPPR